MHAAELSPGPSTWRVIHARATGTSHLNSGLACQDALGWCVLPCGLLAIALADGAGSAPLAETGANLAVETALASLQKADANQVPQDMQAWGDAVRQAFLAARQCLLQEAADTSQPVNALATTLICLVAAEDGLVLGQVGDSLLVARTPQGDLYTLSRAQRGEYANETTFLTMPDALDRTYIQAVELDLAGLAVMSDGLLRLAVKLPEYTPHAPFFAPLWTFAARTGDNTQANQQLAEFLASDRVCSRTDDDKSLVLAVKAGYQFGVPDASPVQPGEKDEP